MRLLLDAHVSSRGVGRPLASSGHDVRALDQERALEGLSDDQVLALGWDDRRVLLTHNIADFPTILRDWAAEGRSHAGVILVYGIGHGDFGLVVQGVQRLLQARPQQDDWIDCAAVLSRQSGLKSGIGDE